jgi:predicted ATPase
MSKNRRDKVIWLSKEHGFPYHLAGASYFDGWASAINGDTKHGIAQMIANLRAHRATGARYQESEFLGLLVEAYIRDDDTKAALGAVDEALEQVEKTRERYYAAEINRLKGALLLKSGFGEQDTAEAYFRSAIEIAHEQKAKMWELRAATSLAQLWAAQGKRAQAHDLLASVYDWFTEGFDTADLKEAKALLEELR